MIKSLLFLVLMLIVTSCSSYKWVDTADCKDEVGSMKKCRLVD